MSDAPVPEAIILTLGPILVGSLISFCLFGISIVQLYLYHLSFPKDRSWVKLLVYSVFILDIGQSLVVADTSWTFLVNGWGRQESLVLPGWGFFLLPMLDGIVALIVQSFYAWRIYLLGHWRIVPCIIIFWGLASCGAACGISISGILLPDVRTIHVPNMAARTYIWLAGAALTDVIISVSMLYLLFGARDSKFSKTQRLVNRLIRLTIETGAVTATTALVDLIFFVTLPENNEMHLICALSLCKVYSNSLMTSLNARAVNSLSKGGALTTGGSVPWSSVSSPSTFESNKRHVPGAVIHIQTSSDSRTDTLEGGRSLPVKSTHDRDNLEMQNLSDRDGKLMNLDHV